MLRFFSLLLSWVALAACSQNEPQALTASTAATPKGAALVEHRNSALPPHALPGGSATVVDFALLSERSAEAFSRPFANLDAEQRMRFVVGNSFFTQPWVSAGASVSGRDGLGPLFNAAACQDCHIRDGRGLPPSGPDDVLRSAVLRIARADGTADPIYGRHIQTRSLPGMTAEARVAISWQEHAVTLHDGQRISLRQPQIQITEWAYGPAADDLRMSLRIAQPMIGMGLLEAIPASAIRQQRDRMANGQVPGRAAQVHDIASGTQRLGRFGWKATQPSVRQQSLDALINDIGITSALFPEQNCSPTQQAIACRHFASGGQPELQPDIEAALVFYAQHLAPPARREHARPEVRNGEQLFHRIGCADCHRPSWQTAASSTPASANQLIWPYSDMLLHDMGPGLADGIIEGAASGQHWRTQPLWGLGQVKTVGGASAAYLHDGRARSLSEAILWHGGDAAAARDAWAALTRAQRDQLLLFLESL